MVIDGQEAIDKDKTLTDSVLKVLNMGITQWPYLHYSKVRYCVECEVMWRNANSCFNCGKEFVG